jgi:L-fuconolactonase
MTHMTKIDAHQHFWNYELHAADYVWMGAEDGALKRNFLPPDLAPLLEATGYAGTIAVQARELPQETQFLLDLAAEYPLIKGVVGWLDLCAPDIEQQIAAYATNPKLKGLRMLIHDHPDVNFADSPAHVRGIATLEKFDLRYDLLLRPQHIAASIRLVDQFPHQLFVIDHIAKPRICDAMDHEWVTDIKEIARRPNVYCKLSGLSTLATPDRLTLAQFNPYLDIVIEAFGAQRCMIGSDWPVSTLGVHYTSMMGLMEQCVAALSSSEKEAIFGHTCTSFYQLQSII